jgi:predicted alpha/beta hydrolase
MPRPRALSSNGVSAGARRGAAAESLDIRTRDGWSLRADVRSPDGAPRGVAVLAHALMARRTEFYRNQESSFATFLVASGWRVVAFDFRGHGDSGPAARQGGAYGYDDFVARDLAAVCAFAREQAGGGEPLVVVGHSMGGHAAFVAQGTGAIAVDALVGIGGAPPFLRDHEPSRARWLLKRAAFASMLAAARRVGHFPARALRLGSDDESLGCCEDLERVARTGRWTSRDGRIDYLAALSSVRVPVLQVVSERDRFECVPECGVRFVACCGGPIEVVRVARGDGESDAPTHMGLVTSRRTRGVWGRIEAWMGRAPAVSRPDGPRRSGRSFPG